MLLKLLILYMKMKSDIPQHKIYNDINAVGPGGKEF